MDADNSPPPHTANGDPSTPNGRFADDDDSAHGHHSNDVGIYRPRPNGAANSHAPPSKHLVGSQAQRAAALRHSHPHLTEAARDPRDEAPHITPTSSRPASPYTQFPPVDFDGLSWPSMFLPRRPPLCPGTSRLGGGGGVYSDTVILPRPGHPRKAGSNAGAE